MQLIRVAVISLSDPAPPRVLQVEYHPQGAPIVVVEGVRDAEIDRTSTPLDGSMGTTVHLPELGKRAAKVLVCSRVDGLPVELDEMNRLVVPVDARRQMEAAIEEFADLLAVAHQCRRTIRSPQTCVVAVPEHEGEFGDAVEMSLEDGRSPTNTRLLPDLCVDKIADLMVGRRDGLRLLASGLSEVSPGGRAREYYRLIEAAFGSALNSLSKPLYEYLKTGPFADALGFHKKEIDHWIRVRGSAMHADKSIALDADVLPFLGRLEWAAYDLLLHKLDWGTRDVARRVEVAPVMSGLDASNSLVLFHPSASIQIRFADSFGVYAIEREEEVSVGGQGAIVNWPTPTSMESVPDNSVRNSAPVARTQQARATRRDGPRRPSKSRSRRRKRRGV